MVHTFCLLARTTIIVLVYNLLHSLFKFGNSSNKHVLNIQICCHLRTYDKVVAHFFEYVRILT